MDKQFKGFGLTISHVSALSGGLTNACLKVEAKEGSFVWRPISLQAKILGADRAKEHEILQALSDESFSPNVYGANEEGILVEWLEGEVIALDKAQDVAVDLLCSVHQISLDKLSEQIKNKPMSLKDRIIDYWNSITPENQTSEMKAYFEYFSLQDEQAFFSHCLCHYDIGAYNIIVKEDGYGLIDWEYASMGDPSQDLTSMIIANQFDMDDVISQYCQKRRLNIDEWKRAVIHWTPWVTFMGVLWFSLGYQLLKNTCYQELAEREMCKLIKLLPSIYK
ncbi:thiamine kinase [Aliivibrio fischeri]|uniref:thiamine kinase n=2 Tax=Aliivibrio fischeri TaxID=668 RepID=UPI0007C51F78|nr:thiamine kinase [Aliivibrio fischeri]MBP3141702.1 thiamine kinase [Aliivibrio fischeri]MBP3157679.1 thiamine kinase [Aliivibrio fischeri]